MIYITDVLTQRDSSYQSLYVGRVLRKVRLSVKKGIAAFIGGLFFLAIALTVIYLTILSLMV